MQTSGMGSTHLSIATICTDKWGANSKALRGAIATFPAREGL